MTNNKPLLLFLMLFSFVGFLALQIPFTKLAGSNISFTLFDFFAPIAGAFLGPVLGVISVLGVELVNYFFKQTPLTTASIIRLFPVLFAVYYFGAYSKKNSTNKLILFIPIISMVFFVSHPTGRSVWYYSLFWLIPLVAYLKRDYLLARSLGATFTAHAVGGAAWIWTFNLPSNVWNSLIPIVIQERLLFALGISASYIVIKYTLVFLMSKNMLPRLESIYPSLNK